MRTLVLLRHGKSDWSVPASDVDRPLTERGRRQAAEAGHWLAEIDLELALVSPAARARDAWEIANTAGVRTRIEPAAYTFDGAELLALVRGLDEQLQAVAIVGHNPALEDLVSALTGEWLSIKTSGIVLIELEDWGGSGRVRGQGRPPAQV